MPRVQKQKYHCYLDGKFYGSGSLAYVQELFINYVVFSDMYGADEVEFKIEKKYKRSGEDE